MIKSNSDIDPNPKTTSYQFDIKDIWASLVLADQSARKSISHQDLQIFDVWYSNNIPAEEVAKRFGFTEYRIAKAIRTFWREYEYNLGQMQLMREED